MHVCHETCRPGTSCGCRGKYFGVGMARAFDLVGRLDSDGTLSIWIDCTWSAEQTRLARVYMVEEIARLDPSFPATGRREMRRTRKGEKTSVWCTYYSFGGHSGWASRVYRTAA